MTKQFVILEDVLTESNRVEQESQHEIKKSFQETYGEVEGGEMYKQFNKMRNGLLKQTFDNTIGMTDEGLEVNKENLVRFFTAFLVMASNSIISEEIGE